MGCFAVQKSKKKFGEQVPKTSEVGDPEFEDLTATACSSPMSPQKPSLSTVPSFKRAVKVIQNAQKFINHSSPRFSSANPSHGSRDVRSSEQGMPVNDVDSPNKPMRLPSPRHTPAPARYYALPHPCDHIDVPMSCPDQLEKNTSISHAAQNSRVFPCELQPLPLPKDSSVMPECLKSFPLDQIRSACQNFSAAALAGDDGYCFNGAIQASGKGANKQEKFLVLRLQEGLHLDIREWLRELYAPSHRPSKHVCNLIGFHDEDGTRLLVYERLQKGNLHSVLFQASDTLKWPARMKVIQDAVEGLTSLQERFPEQVLYKDFRLSHIQVDSENNAKVSGYWFVTSSSQSVQAHVLSSSNNARENAYCAPETRSKGILTWKSTVWSLGITILELLCGKQHKDEQVVKDEKQNLVKWAKPLLLEEAKHFLIMDSKLKGDFEPKDVKVMANIILQCIQRDPGKRPSMKTVLDMLKTTKETKQLRASTWRENSSNKVMGPMSAPLFGLGSSESANSGALDNKSPSYVRSPTMVKLDCARSPPKFDLVQSPALKRLIIPPRSSVE